VKPIRSERAIEARGNAVSFMGYFALTKFD